MIPGSLTKVPGGAFPKEMTFDDSQWFTVNYQIASQVLKDIYDNYKKYKVKAHQLKVYTQAFSFERMKEQLEEMITPLLDSVPKQVDLKLPKLEKLGGEPKEKSEDGKLKLPKLKKMS